MASNFVCKIEHGVIQQTYAQHILFEYLIFYMPANDSIYALQYCLRTPLKRVCIWQVVCRADNGRVQAEVCMGSVATVWTLMFVTIVVVPAYALFFFLEISAVCVAFNR